MNKKRHSNVPETSLEAWDHLQGTTLKPSQRLVLATMARLTPCTQQALEKDEQLSARFSPSRIRTAVSELERLKLVINTKEKTKLPSGRSAFLWEPKLQQRNLF